MSNLIPSQCCLAVAVILYVCGHVKYHVTGGTADINAPRRLNVINDASFERDDDVTAWAMSDRMSMWTVERRARVSRDCDVGRTGRCSLRFDSLEAGKFRAVFVSQYINDSSLSGPLRVEFWIRGSRLDHFRLQLDVSYVDPRRQLTVNIKPDAEVEANSFKRKCVVVPDYGYVRAMMLHLVVEAEEQSGSDAIQVDDVIVSNQVTDDVVQDCQPYVDFRPRYRHVVADFLSPAKFEPEMDKATSCRPGSDTGDDVITLATQMSVDRLSTLGHAASLWAGPVSAAILIFDDDAIGSILAAYNRSMAMRSCVTVHLVHAIDRDAELFPVNFLRNIAIAHARSGRVFYVDVDIIVGSAKPVWPRAAAAMVVASHYSCISHDFSDKVDRRVFIAPVFNVKSPVSSFFDAGTGHCSLPCTKTELLDRLRDPGSGFEPIYSVSHSIVNYRHWYSSTEPYEVKYTQNVEPYFIVHSSAPVMNDFYAGYGRDKCAYSRDLAELGYRFIVLPEAFLINVYEEIDQWTIYRRSRGVQLGMFLNAAFHEEDLRARFFRYPADYNCRVNGTTLDEEFQEISSKLADGIVVNESENPKIDLESEHHMPTRHTFSTENFEHTIETNDMERALAQNAIESRSDPEQKTSSDDVAVNHGGVYSESQKCAADSEDNVNGEVCHGSNDSCGSLLFHDLPMLTLSNRMIPPDRLDIIVELLMIDYGVTTYIQVGSDSVTGSVSGMLPMNQPDAIITAVPYSDMAQNLTNGIFTSYRNLDGPLPLLSTIAATFLVPKLYLFDVNSAELARSPGNSFQEYVGALMDVATDHDVIVIVGNQYISSFADEHVPLLCRRVRRRSGWTLYRVEKFLALKPDSLLRPSPLLLPPFPVCPHSDIVARPDVESSEWKPVVDVILLTKNRPLQTFAFLDSLSTFVSGVNTVWIVYKSEDPLYDSGYQLVNSCFQATEKNISFHVELVGDVNGLGLSVMDVLRTRSAASHVVLAVDELIWLNKVDLVDVAWLLPLCHTGQDSDEIFSAQLRLGNHIRDFRSFPDYNKRFLHLANFSASSIQDDIDNLYAYYPRRLPYDFGYILNIDGAVFRRRDILSDFESANSDRCRIPGCLEQGWIRRSLHRRSRQWQLTFSNGRLVNNQLEDGRVAARNEGSSDASRRLAATLVEDRRKMDIMSFAEKHKRPRSVHVWQPVEYIDLDSTC